MRELLTKHLLLFKNFCRSSFIFRGPENSSDTPETQAPDSKETTKEVDWSAVKMAAGNAQSFIEAQLAAIEDFYNTGADGKEKPAKEKVRINRIDFMPEDAANYRAAGLSEGAIRVISSFVNNLKYLNGELPGGESKKDSIFRALKAVVNRTKATLKQVPKNELYKGEHGKAGTYSLLDDPHYGSGDEEEQTPVAEQKPENIDPVKAADFNYRPAQPGIPAREVNRNSPEWRLADKFYKEALTLQEKGDKEKNPALYEQAFELFKKSFEQFASPNTQYAMANILYKLGRYAEAYVEVKGLAKRASEGGKRYNLVADHIYALTQKIRAQVDKSPDLEAALKEFRRIGEQFGYIVDLPAQDDIKVTYIKGISELVKEHNITNETVLTRTSTGKKCYVTVNNGALEWGYVEKSGNTKFEHRVALGQHFIDESDVQLAPRERPKTDEANGKMVQDAVLLLEKEDFTKAADTALQLLKGKQKNQKYKPSGAAGEKLFNPHYPGVDVNRAAFAPLYKEIEDLQEQVKNSPDRNLVALATLHIQKIAKDIAEETNGVDALLKANAAMSEAHLAVRAADVAIPRQSATLAQFTQEVNKQFGTMKLANEMPNGTTWPDIGIPGMEVTLIKTGTGKCDIIIHPTHADQVWPVLAKDIGFQEGTTQQVRVSSTGKIMTSVES